MTPRGSFSSSLDRHNRLELPAQFRNAFADAAIAAAGIDGKVELWTPDTFKYVYQSPAGNKGSESTVGPVFKFEDVNVFDLNLTGSKASVGVCDRFRFVAKLDSYNEDQCLL